MRRGVTLRVGLRVVSRTRAAEPPLSRGASERRCAYMAAGWITQINNFSDSAFTIRTDDQTWRPVINSVQFAVDAPIAVPPRRTSATFVPIPFFPGGGMTIPPGPTTLNVQYMMIGWIDFARTRIDGPGGSVELTIGPKPPS